MSNEAPIRLDLISVSAEVSEELAASAADLFVSIVGQSFFTGSAALEKTKEVNDLVVALSSAGIAAKDIQLQSVRATTSSGVLRKSSAATYQLRIHCQTLESVGEAIGAITSQKNTDLRPIVWRYPDNDGVHDRLLNLATQRAHERARRIADNLGIRLAGVHRYVEEFADPESMRRNPFVEGATAGVRARIDKTIDRLEDREELGMAVSHLKEARLRVEIDYYVSDYFGGTNASTPDARGCDRSFTAAIDLDAV
jgi:uncharacterized protein YggE